VRRGSSDNRDDDVGAGLADSRRPPLARALCSEFAGTFALVSVVALGKAVAASTGKVGDAELAVAPGLMIMAMIFALSDVSGAHFNPAVTFAFALRRTFPLGRVTPYVVAQFSGAVAAALMVRSLYGTSGMLGATQPTIGLGRGLAIETLLSWLLVSVILHTAKRKPVVGVDAAFAVAATIILCGLIGAPATGASMNPARSIGPALVVSSWRGWWIYVVGPIIGATLATFTTLIIHGSPTTADAEAAQGDEQ
jgi:aquaporin Z